MNGCAENKTIAAFVFAIRLYCSHSASNGMIESHLQSVVPYGRSHKIKSMLPSGMSFISSKQSPFNSLTGHKQRILCTKKGTAPVWTMPSRYFSIIIIHRFMYYIQLHLTKFFQYYAAVLNVKSRRFCFACIGIEQTYRTVTGIKLQQF